MSERPTPTARALAAQVRVLQQLVLALERQIGRMESSRFWKLRNVVVGWLGGATSLSPTAQPVEPIDDETLLRLQIARDPEDLAWLASIARKITLSERFAVVLDPGEPADAEITLASLRAQLYPHWSVTVDDFADADYVVGVRAGDRLDPEALLAIAIAMDDGADVVYTDSESQAGIETKPGWSPETLLGRDYVGVLCAFRMAALRAVGGVDPTAGAWRWYDALLRVSESPCAIRHLPRVLVARAAELADSQQRRSLVEVACARRGEPVHFEPVGAFMAPRFMVNGEPRVAIVIPTHDRDDLVRSCLESIFTRTAYANFEVVVVDHRSSSQELAATLRRFGEQFPQQFRVVRNDEPFHFSRLVNAGVAATDARFVALLNNDTEIIEPAWLSLMLGQAQRAAIGAVGALLLYPDETVQHAGFILGSDTDGGDHAFRGVAVAEAGEIPELWLDTNYAAITGAALLVERTKFTAAGGFDDAFAVEYGDVDFCLRLAAAGYRNVVVPRARLYHREMASRGPNDRIAKRTRAVLERATFAERWGNYLQNDPFCRKDMVQPFLGKDVPSRAANIKGFWPPKTSELENPAENA